MKTLIILLLSASTAFAQTGRQWRKEYKMKFIYTNRESLKVCTDTAYITEGEDSVMFTWAKLAPLTYMKTCWTNVDGARLPAPRIGTSTHAVALYGKK